MYYGHGTPLQNLPLYIGNLDQWQNDKFPVLYISGGCNFRDSLPTVRSLSEELLIRTNGASSAFGSSGGGGYGYDYYFSLGVMKTLFKPCTVGELLNNASRIMYNRAVDEQQDVGIGSFTYYAMHRISLTGDPAISLKPLSEFE
jgi:hypothetical protein